MNKQFIKIPRGIEYISDLPGYDLPYGQCIVDKGVTGCGYTEFCLRNNRNVVLCSPRKLLLENKREQHLDDPNIFYFENNLENYESLLDIKYALEVHMLGCTQRGLPVKFMVTYDSSKYIVDFLNDRGVLQDFTFVVDEFQSIFLDAYFKAGVELNFVEYLQDCNNVIYLSATPMLDKYLDLLDYFKDLPMYTLDWGDSGHTEKIKIKRKHTNSLGAECKKIIEKYASGNFDVALDENGNLVQSTEVVFYFNSISDITRIIKGSDYLFPDNTNIICADTPENRDKIKRIKKKVNGKKRPFSLGKVPLRGETNKMFTFCTRSVYIGADFYSTCASTYIFADPNLDCLALDISLDLPQIAGRQRLKENPFKNNITIFYKTIKGENIEDRAQFDAKQEMRRKITKDLLDGYEGMTPDQRLAYNDKIRDGITVSQYSKDFVSLSEKTNFPVYNSLVEIANERAWEVSQKDYQDSITVTKALQRQFEEGNYTAKEEEIVKDFLDNHFYTTGIFEEKMKMYCEFMDQYKDQEGIVTAVYHKIKDDRFQNYYNILGTDRCRALRYQDADIKAKLKELLSSSDLKTIITSEFLIGHRYTARYIKAKLQEIYNQLGLRKTAKATDLRDYFDIKRVVAIDENTQERLRGFEILGIK